VNDVAWPLFAGGRSSGAASILPGTAGRGAFGRLPSPIKSSETKPYSTDMACLFASFSIPAQLSEKTRIKLDFLPVRPNIRVLKVDKKGFVAVSVGKLFRNGNEGLRQRDGGPGTSLR
jgi:hypothetical protein